MFRKLKFKLLSIAACILILSSNAVVGQAASSIQDNYTKKIAIGLIGLNNISTLDFTLTDNYYIQENNMALSKGSKYNISLSNSIFILTQDGKQIASLPGITICPTLGTSYISFIKNTYTRYFSGTMTFNKLTANTFVPVNKLGIEDYIKGVVPYESSESYPVEALKAQAVAARTYALANLGKYSARGYDLTDNTSCQVYQGYSSICPKSNQAVEATRGQVLTYNGSIISALFSASNGGYTEDSANVWSSSYPYFKSKPDSFDNDPYYNWTKTFTADEIDAALKAGSKITAADKFTGINLTTIKYYLSGRVSNIEINYTDSTGAAQTKAFSKEGARTFLSLRSGLYMVTFDAVTKKYTFTGKGYGHGIGMSQIGARNRALSGQTYLQILNFYYDNTAIMNLIQTGWVSQGDGKTYYMDAKGVPVLSKWVLNAQGSWTYLGADGAVVSNKWQQDNSKRWFYLGPDGVMVSNKLQQDSSTRWFYLGADGAMVASKWVYNSNKWYYFGTDGAMAVNTWKQDGSKRWFYLGANGDMVTSQWVYYKGTWYYLNADGAMAVNTTVDGYKINSWGGSNKPA